VNLPRLPTRRFLVLVAAVAVLSACGTGDGLCGPMPSSPYPACPPFDCVQQCGADRAACLEVCTRGGCLKCRSARWVTIAYDCPTSCR
jgi:hypothetical protein